VALIDERLHERLTPQGIVAAIEAARRENAGGGGHH